MMLGPGRKGNWRALCSVLASECDLLGVQQERLRRKCTNIAE